MPVNLDISNGIALLRVSNPPGNYLDEDITGELLHAVRKVDADPEIRVIVIAGEENGSFLLHYNLRDVEKDSRRLVDSGASFGEHRHIPERKIDLLFRQLESSGKISIAAITGTALGGAMELALACDFRVFQRGDHVMGVPEALIGMLPGAGGTQRLTHIVGPAKALDLILHGRRLAAEELLQAEIVHEVADDCTGRSMERARDLAKLPAKTLSSVKRLVRAARTMPVYEALELERALFLELMAMPEALELVTKVNAEDRDFRTV